MSSDLSPINRAFNLIPKRAEARHARRLRETFVDSGIAVALEAIDHQVLYGRRGTGKTHALRYLETIVIGRGDLSVYVDLRTVGSPGGLFAGEELGLTERAGRLLVDLLGQMHDALLTAVVENDELIVDVTLVRSLDSLLEAITTVRLTGEVEVAREGERKNVKKGGVGFSVFTGSNPKLGITGSQEDTAENRLFSRETRRGSEQIALNFGDLARALRNLIQSLSGRRIWLLLDEWSSVPPDIQPYLGEFLVRCVLPLQQISVKIGAIEQQSNFRAYLDNGQTIGIELGADVAANVDLDEFMVFEQNEDRARNFFRSLLFKHVRSEPDDTELIGTLQEELDIVRLGFSDKRAFDELVRAAEGVPRDALNIIAKAALRAGSQRISVPAVRFAARAWFQTDKEAALRSRDEAQRLLNWIIDKVIRQKRARGLHGQPEKSIIPITVGAIRRKGAACRPARLLCPRCTWRTL